MSAQQNSAAFDAVLIELGLLDFEARLEAGLGLDEPVPYVLADDAGMWLT